MMRARDEIYIINLCDRVLGLTASRQHTFDWLRGDPLVDDKPVGRKLRVDAFYEKLKLVIEYRERQHSEPVKIMDARMTISGIPRGMQRALYDQRRRDEIPKHGLNLIELDYAMFQHKAGSKKLLRMGEDEEIIRRLLNTSPALTRAE
jgi:hypothetical protein